MKIQCTNCATVFFIDDSLISGKGVKAQCPRCGHQTVVRSDSSAGAQSPAMGQNLGYSSSPGPNMGMPTHAMQPPGAPPMPAGPGDSFFGDQSNYFGGTNNYFGGAGATPGAAPGMSPGVPPQMAAPGMPPAPSAYMGPTAPADPLGGYVAPQAPPQAPPSSPLLPANLIQPHMPDSVSPDIPSPLVVPQDDGATKIQPHPSMPYTASTPQEDLGRLDPNWLKIRRIATGEEIGPVSLKEVRSLYVHGKITLDDEYAGEDLEWCPIRNVPALLDILQRTPQLGQRGGRVVTPKHVAQTKKFPWILVVLLSLVVAGGGGGGAYYYFMMKSPQGKLPAPGRRTISPSVDLLGELSQKWRETYPNIKFNAKLSRSLTVKGMKLLARDQERSYEKAIELFQQALLANRKNIKALAGLAIAKAWKPRSNKGSHAARAHENTQYEVLLRRQSNVKKNPLLRAAYALYLKDDPDKALSLAQYAARKAPKEALAQVIAGEIWLTQQQDYKKSRDRLQRALKQNDQLARARVLMAQITMRKAYYYQTAQLLQPLVRKQHPQAMFQQAQLYIHKGQYAQARALLQQLLKRHRHFHKARLLLATMLYQQLRLKKPAYRYLMGFRKKDGLSRALRLRVLLHRAYVDLISARMKQANRRIQSLYKINKNYLPGLFLDAQYQFLRRKYDAALERLQRVAARLPSEPKLQILIALSKERQGKLKEAIALYNQLADQNSRYIWPRLLLAGVYLQQNQTNKALLKLKSALDVEPDLLHNRQRPSAYYIVPQVWQSLLERFQSARGDSRSIYIAAAGMALYQIGDMRQAAKLLRRSLALDSKGLAANLYMAQYLYDTNQLGKAARHALRAYQVYDQHAISVQILGLVALKQRRYRRAHAYFSQVRRSRPWFITGQVGQALSYHGLGRSNDAMAELKPLLDSFNYHHFLARALHRLKR